MIDFEVICNEQDAARASIRQAVIDMKNAGIKEGIYKAANWLRYDALINKRTWEQRQLLKELADEMEKGI
jgi:hypothetical protein